MEDAGHEDLCPDDAAGPLDELLIFGNPETRRATGKRVRDLPITPDKLI